MRIYSLIKEEGFSSRDIIDSIVPDMQLTPAEISTLEATGVLDKNGIRIQLESEPKEYTAVEIVHFEGDKAHRWGCNGDKVTRESW